VSPVTTDRILPPVSLGQGGARPVTTAAPPTVVLQGEARAVIVPVAASPTLRDRVDARVRKASGRPTVIAPAAQLAKPRGDALHSTATRAGVLVGVSAAIYAVSLAAVAGLEAHTQAQAAADAQPGLDAIAIVTSENDAMDAAIQDASARLQQLANTYNSTSTDMSAYQAQFQRLSTLVAKIQGSAAAMNANFRLPAVTVHGAIGGGGGGGGTVVVTTSGGSGKP
jgi:hypothetical protein